MGKKQLHLLEIIFYALPIYLVLFRGILKLKSGAGLVVCAVVLVAACILAEYLFFKLNKNFAKVTGTKSNLLPELLSCGFIFCFLLLIKNSELNSSAEVFKTILILLVFYGFSIFAFRKLEAILNQSEKWVFQLDFIINHLSQSIRDTINSAR